MGGMGVSLGTNLVTGLPVIHSMLIDSPAQKAGLQVGDTIVKVNGMSTIGRSLEEVRRKAHGFANGKISITVLRSQSNLVECVVHRNSWNKLRELTSNPYE
jgi:carboxyl-terminal processing protease